jgi:hypothetical protein
MSGSRAERERRYRRIPLTDAHLARFHAELPALVTYLEQRLIPGHRRWGLGAMAYGLMTAIGLYALDWSPMLVLAHLLLSQWIPLIAEVLVLRRLQRRGITRLVAADHVYRFVNAVLTELTRDKRPWDPKGGPQIRESDLLDSEIPSDSSDKAHPGGLAVTLLFFATIATAILAVTVYYTDYPVREALLSQPVAVLALGLASLAQLHHHYLQKLSPPIPGATWSVEFTPGLRVFSVVLLGMLSPVAIQSDPQELREVAVGIPLIVAAWGFVSWASLSMWNKPLAMMRRYRDADPPELRTLSSTRG